MKKKSSTLPLHLEAEKDIAFLVPLRGIFCAIVGVGVIAAYQAVKNVSILLIVLRDQPGRQV